jgi:hypothetical protein
MDTKKSLDEVVLIATLLRDVSKSHGAVFNSNDAEKTLQKVRKRVDKEGFGFLAKSLPKLGKALDKALTGIPLDATSCGFEPAPDSKLPVFLGELFNRILDKSGMPLDYPCVESVRDVRQILYLFYKYELPYTAEQTSEVVQKFEKTDADLSQLNCTFNEVRRCWELDPTGTARERKMKKLASWTRVGREARILLARLLASFDPKDIIPRHGPGAVSTKEKLWEKYQWRNVSAKLAQEYPLDEYFIPSLGALADNPKLFESWGDVDLPARVVLVPKDSRGPRLISCEPVDFQWVQQGISRRLVAHTEDHWLTKHNVFFTDQGPNQRGALLGSLHGQYATLDLNEASDRVSLGLVELLWPDNIARCLMAARSSATRLPDGRLMKLNKFAPMGSSLCFPVMALTIWAILTAGVEDKDTRESILVYGDDVIVRQHYAANAIERLESFGLKVNRDKSCTSGFFRESCGVEALKGSNVTPLRIRTVWSSIPSPESYLSWITYANSLRVRGYVESYDYVVACLHELYGAIPEIGTVPEGTPALLYVDEPNRPQRSRVNFFLQKRELYVRLVKAPKVRKVLDGWSMLLRFFTEAAGSVDSEHVPWGGAEDSPFGYRRRWRSLSEYTRPRTLKFVRGWR